MYWMHEYYAVTDFLDKGGVTLYIIFFVAIFLWVLIVERFLYIYIFSKKDQGLLANTWDKYKTHPQADKIRMSLKAEYEEKLFFRFSIIKVLVAIAPLLGLFGTVYGMIEIFDVIAHNGTGDARAMASGISMATLPTMSGMAVAITGLFFQHKIKEKVDKETISFNERLKNI